MIERKCHRHRAFCEVIRPSLSHRFIGLHLISLEGRTIDIPAVFRMVAVPTCSVFCRIVYLYFVANLLKEKKNRKKETIVEKYLENELKKTLLEPLPVLKG